MFSPNMRSVFFFIIITFFFIEQSYILPQKLRHERHTDVHTREISTSTRTTLEMIYESTRQSVHLYSQAAELDPCYCVFAADRQHLYFTCVYACLCRVGMYDMTTQAQAQKEGKCPIFFIVLSQTGLHELQFLCLFLHLCLYCLRL